MPEGTQFHARNKTPTGVHQIGDEAEGVIRAGQPGLIVHCKNRDFAAPDDSEASIVIPIMMQRVLSAL